MSPNPDLDQPAFRVKIHFVSLFSTNIKIMQSMYADGVFPRIIYCPKTMVTIIIPSYASKDMSKLRRSTTFDCTSVKFLG